MLAAPSFDGAEAASLAALKPRQNRLAIGLHLTLTGPFRPLSEGFRPLQRGTFLPFAATVRASLLGGLSSELLRREIAAQIAAFSDAFGRAPDFVDGHLHVHLLPRIRDAVVGEVKRVAPHAWVRQCGRSVPMRKRLRDPKGLFLDALSASLRRRAEACGVATNPAFAGTYVYRHDANFAQLFPSFLESLAEDSLVMCHPGFVDSELIRVDPLTSLREREYAYLMGEEFPRVLERHGYALS
jgi:predicted glycoside hydrolase/deacetylase ChbG (UPF0249 family)